MKRSARLAVISFVAGLFLFFGGVQGYRHSFKGELRLTHSFGVEGVSAQALVPCTLTQNVQFQIPNIGNTTNWGTCLNYDLNKLDVILGGAPILSVGATAPTISASGNYQTANTSSTPITNFIGGYPGQTIRIFCGSSDTFTSLSAGTYLGVASPWSCATSASISLTLIGSKWVETGRWGGGSSGSSIFTSYQFGSNSSITGSGNYVQTIATPSTVVSLTQTGSGAVGNPFVDTIVLSVQGTDNKLLSSGTISGTGATLCTDSLGGATTVDCTSGGISAVTASAPIASSGGSTPNLTCPTCAVTSSPLNQFTTTTPVQLASVISSTTGTGPLVFGTNPAFTSPTLGSALATQITIGGGPVISGSGSTLNLGSTNATVTTGGVLTVASCTGCTTLPTLYYQTLKANGTAQTQRPTENLIAGANVTVACVDNSGAQQTDCTITSSNTGSTAFSALTPATNSNAGNFIATGNSWSFSGATAFILPVVGASFPGSGSGTATVVAQAAAGTPTLTLPSASGTFAVSASGALSLNATTGALTASNATSGAVGVIQLTNDIGGSATAPQIVGLRGIPLPTLASSTGALYDNNGTLQLATLGTVTSVTGTANQISVSTGTTTPVLSFPNNVVFPGTVQATTITAITAVVTPSVNNVVYGIPGTSLQTMFNLLGNGVHLIVPPGTYNVTAQATFPIGISNFKVDFDPGVTINPTSAITTYVILAQDDSYYEVSGGTINMNSNAYGCMELLSNAASVTNVYIHDMFCENSAAASPSAGFFLQTTTTGVPGNLPYQNIHLARLHGFNIASGLLTSAFVNNFLIEDSTVDTFCVNTTAAASGCAGFETQGSTNVTFRKDYWTNMTVVPSPTNPTTGIYCVFSSNCVVDNGYGTNNPPYTDPTKNNQEGAHLDTVLGGALTNSHVFDGGTAFTVESSEGITEANNSSFGSGGNAYQLQSNQGNVVFNTFNSTSGLTPGSNITLTTNGSDVCPGSGSTASTVATVGSGFAPGSILSFTGLSGTNLYPVVNICVKSSVALPYGSVQVQLLNPSSTVVSTLNMPYLPAATWVNLSLKDYQWGYHWKAGIAGVNIVATSALASASTLQFDSMVQTTPLDSNTLVGNQCDRPAESCYYIFGPINHDVISKNICHDPGWKISNSSTNGPYSCINVDPHISGDVITDLLIEGNSGFISTGLNTTNANGIRITGVSGAEATEIHIDQNDMSSFGSTNAIVLAGTSGSNYANVSQYNNKIDSGTAMFVGEQNSASSGNSVYNISPLPASSGNSASVQICRETVSNDCQMKLFIGNNTSTVGVLLDATNGFINTNFYEAGNNYELTLTNDGTTGTSNNHTAVVTSTGTAILPTIGSTTGVYGIVQTQGGTTGSAQVVIAGKVSCVFDGAVTAGDHVTLSQNTAGDCTDAGATSPLNSQDIGIVTSTSGSAGTFNVDLNVAPSTVSFLPSTTAGVYGTLSTTGNGAANLLIDAIPTTGNQSNVDVCRNTNTSGDCALKVFLGNGTSTVGVLLDGSNSLASANEIRAIYDTVTVPNDTSTGTTVNKLATVGSTGAIITTAGATRSSGVVTSGAGTSGNANLAVTGRPSCVFDGATTQGHYVTISASVNGDCTDAGTSPPSSTQNLGIAMETHGGGGTYTFFSFGPGGSVSGGGGGPGTGTMDALAYWSSTSVLGSLASPTTNGFYVVGFNVTASGAVVPTATLQGVPPNAQTGTSYTINGENTTTTDRLKYVTFNNAGAVAVTIPQAGSSGFTNNFAFVTCDIGAGTATYTPTTSTISYTTGTGYTSAASSMALTTGQCAFVYSDNSNWFALQIAGGSSGANTALSNLASVNINTALLAQASVDLGSTTKPFRNEFLYGTGTYGSTYVEITTAPTAARTWTIQDTTDTFVGRATTDTLTNKSIAASEINSGIFTVPQGGTGLGTLTSNTIYKGNGTSALSATSITDNGTIVATTEGITALSIAVGTSPPSLTPGTGGASAGTEGTAPSVGFAVGVDVEWNDSTNHCVHENWNNVDVGCIVALTATQTLTNKSIAASEINSGTLAVAQGGTNLGSGTSGGILGFTATGTIASSAALGSGALVIGGGAGALPTAVANNASLSTGALTLGSSGIAGSVILNGSSSGTCTLNLTSTSGTLQLCATGNTITAGGVLTIPSSGSYVFNGGTVVKETGGNGFLNITNSAGTSGAILSSGNKTFVTSDFTDSTSTTLTLVTGLSYTLAASTAQNFSFHCSLLFDQGTAAVSDQIGVGVTGTAPTNLNASAVVYPSTSTLVAGTLTGLATTTATSIVTFTPSATGTIWNAVIDGTIEQPSNATPGVLGVYVSTATGTDNLIVKRGSFCTIN